MAKNKTNGSLFGTESVNELVQTTEETIARINSEEGLSSEPQKATTERRTIKRETKSKRINLLVRPSVYEAVVAKAEAEGVSVNELINSFMEKLVK